MLLSGETDKKTNGAWQKYKKSGASQFLLLSVTATQFGGKNLFLLK